MHTMSITTARKEFLDLPEAVLDEPLFVTRRGRPVMTMLSMDQFEGMLETIEILRDQAFSRHLQTSLEQARAGRTLSLEEVVAQLEG